MTLQALVDQLHRLLPPSEETVEEFLNLVNQLVDTGDPEAIRPILATIDDLSPLSGVTDATLNALEDFPSDIYASELLADLERFHSRSPASAESEIKKFLWSSTDLDVLIDQLPQGDSEIYARLRSILTAIAREVPDLAASCNRVIRHLD